MEAKTRPSLAMAASMQLGPSPVVAPGTQLTLSMTVEVSVQLGHIFPRAPSAKATQLKEMFKGEPPLLKEG